MSVRRVVKCHGNWILIEQRIFHISIFRILKFNILFLSSVKFGNFPTPGKYDTFDDDSEDIHYNLEYFKFFFFLLLFLIMND